MFELHAQTLLAGAGSEVQRTEPVLDQMDLAAEVAVRRALDLDDFRSQVGQQPRGRRTSQVLGKVENFYPVEKFFAAVRFLCHEPPYQL